MRALSFVLILLLAGIALTVSHRAKPLPLLIDAPVHRAAAPICIAPQSHYQWKQRRIA